MTELTISFNGNKSSLFNSLDQLEDFRNDICNDTHIEIDSIKVDNANGYDFVYDALDILGNNVTLSNELVSALEFESIAKADYMRIYGATSTIITSETIKVNNLVTIDRVYHVNSGKFFMYVDTLINGKTQSEFFIAK